MYRMISTFYILIIGCWGSSSSATLNIKDDYKFNLKIMFLHKTTWDPNGERSGFGSFGLPIKINTGYHGPFDFSGSIVIINDKFGALCFDSESIKSLKSIQKTERARDIYKKLI